MKTEVVSVKAEMRHARAVWGDIGTARFRELRRLVNGSSSVRRSRRHDAPGQKLVHHSFRLTAHRQAQWVRGYYGLPSRKNFATPVATDGYLRPLYTSRAARKASLVTVTPIRRMFPLVVRGAEMRVAETRAVNRALRKAYGIGLCSVEELGSLSGPPTSSVGSAQPHRFHAASPSTNGHHPRLRDQLCLLIRQHNLDSTLVKAYAADFCGTQTLKDASRDLVESFISHLAKAAKEDRDALVCKLNSYAQPVEANP